MCPFSPCTNAHLQRQGGNPFTLGWGYGDILVIIEATQLRHAPVDFLENLALLALVLFGLAFLVAVLCIDGFAVGSDACYVWTRCWGGLCSGGLL